MKESARLEKKKEVLEKEKEKLRDERARFEVEKERFEEEKGEFANIKQFSVFAFTGTFFAAVATSTSHHFPLSFCDIHL